MNTPIQAFTRIPYKGYNVDFLLLATSSKGYKSNEWATFLEWKKHGYTVRKGEKSVHCRTFQEDENKKHFVRYFCLFNREQVEKEEQPVPVLTPAFA